MVMNRAGYPFGPDRTAKPVGLPRAIAIERRTKWRKSVKRQASPATLSRIINVGLQSQSDVLRLDR